MDTTNEALKVLVIEDHDLVDKAICSHLQEKYLGAEILSAKTALEAEEKVSLYHPHLIMIDLSIPARSGDKAHIDTGIQLLKSILEKYPELNITVQSGFVQALVRVKSEIDNHQGGFTIADKGLATQDILKRVDWALEGITHTKDLGRDQIEVKPEWLTLLNLAFKKALQDKAIASSMHISKEMVGYHWRNIRDALGVYPEPNKNLRIQTLIRAREEELID